jgi:hypothetical protein
MSLSFDYEFSFPSGSFNQTIYNACTIQDKLGGRQAIIEGKVVEVQNIFNNNVLNLHRFSTFVEYDNKNYKVTVINPERST